MFLAIYLGKKLLKHRLGIAVNGYVGLDYLVKFRRVDIHMYHLCLLHKCICVAGYTVVKSHTHCYHHVGTGGGYVGCNISVHSEHTHIQRVSGWYGRFSEQGASHRYLCFLGKRFQLRLGLCKLYSVSGKNERTLGSIYQCGSCINVALLHLGIGYIAAYVVALLVVVPFHLLKLGILRKVEHHRSRTSRCGYIECSRHRPLYVLGTAYLVAPLGERLGDTYHIGLLEGI